MTMQRVISFGENGRLSGILESDKDAQFRSAMPVLLLNAGIVHRVGPHRLNVKIARALAKKGHPSLRFDLSGLGDSAASPAGRGFEDQAIWDVQTAGDKLCEETNSEQIAIIGLCSGADNAFRTAIIDERFRAICLLDPWAYASPGAKFRYLLSRATDPRAVLRRLSRPLDTIYRVSRGGTNQHESEPERGRPPAEEFGRQLEYLLHRGVSVRIVYSGAERLRLTSPAQFYKTFEAFDLRHGLQVDVCPDVDHTYTQLSAQTWLVEHLLEWLADVSTSHNEHDFVPVSAAL
jgi:pimeloyl-ACP methyl ester carboxylesterase